MDRERCLVMCNREMRMVHRALDLFIEHGTNRIVCPECRHPAYTYSPIHATQHMGPEIKRVMIRARASDGTPWALCVAQNVGSPVVYRPKPNIPELHTQLVRELCLVRGSSDDMMHESGRLTASAKRLRCNMLSVLQQFATSTDKPIPKSLYDYNLEMQPASDDVIASVAWKLLAAAMPAYFDALCVAPDGNIMPHDMFGQNFMSTNMTVSTLINVDNLFVRTGQDLLPALCWYQCNKEEHLAIFDRDNRIASIRMSKNSMLELPKSFNSNELRLIAPERIVIGDLTQYPVSCTVHPPQKATPTSMSNLEYCYLSVETDPHKSVLCLNKTGAVCVSHGDSYLIAYSVIVWYGPCNVGPYWHILCNTQTPIVTSLHGDPRNPEDIRRVEIKQVYEADICVNWREYAMHSSVNCVWRATGYQKAFCQCFTCGRDGYADSGLSEDDKSI